MTIEVRLSPGENVLNISREELEDLIRSNRVGMEAELRDEWTHPGWKRVFAVPRFRRAVLPDSPLGLQWQAEKEEAEKRSIEAARRMWPERFSEPMESTLGVSAFEGLGWNCLAVSRISLCSGFWGKVWALTLSWFDDRVELEFHSREHAVKGQISLPEMPAILADPGSLPELMTKLGPLEITGLDGRTFVHRFACAHTAIATQWWEPKRERHPYHFQIMTAYAECARQLKFDAWGLV